MLTIWNPFAPIAKSDKSDRYLSVRDYVDRAFESTLTDFFTDLSIPFINTGINVKKNEDGILEAVLDIPGVKEENLTIELIDNIIHIKGERKIGNTTNLIEKSFAISADYDPETIKATLSDGVLTIISKPKIEKEVKKIEIISQSNSPALER